MSLVVDPAGKLVHDQTEFSLFMAKSVPVLERFPILRPLTMRVKLTESNKVKGGGCYGLWLVRDCSGDRGVRRIRVPAERTTSSRGDGVSETWARASGGSEQAAGLASRHDRRSITAPPGCNHYICVRWHSPALRRGALFILAGVFAFMFVPLALAFVRDVRRFRSQKEDNQWQS